MQFFADVSKLENDQLERARSLIEAFLLYRLETLPETQGRFKLNQELPIPFNLLGGMEVDLFCEDARLVIEIDGVHHITSKDAYRRDRCKDLFLQQNGYIVLRFLAEDVSRRLDVVLDTILRALNNKKI